jgi:hypothetical protein
LIGESGTRWQHAPAHQPPSRMQLANRVHRCCVREEKRMTSRPHSGARIRRVRCSTQHAHPVQTSLYDHPHMEKVVRLVPPGGPFKTTLLSQSTLRLALLAAVTPTAMLIRATISCIIPGWQNLGFVYNVPVSDFNDFNSVVGRKGLTLHHDISTHPSRISTRMVPPVRFSSTRSSDCRYHHHRHALPYHRHAGSESSGWHRHWCWSSSGRPLLSTCVACQDPHSHAPSRVAERQQTPGHTQPLPPPSPPPPHSTPCSLTGWPSTTKKS